LLGSAANLWVLTLSRFSIIEGVDILNEPHGSNIGPVEGSSPSGPMKSAPLACQPTPSRLFPAPAGTEAEYGMNAN